MTSSTLSAFSSAKADRTIVIWTLVFISVCLAVTNIWLVASWRSTVKKDLDKHPDLVMLTPYQTARMVDWSGVTDTALAGIARTSLSAFVHDYFGRHPQTITDDLTRAWSMLSDGIQGEQRKYFADATAECTTNPTKSVDIEVARVVITSTTPLKRQEPHQAIIDFEKIYKMEGHVTGRELWTATAYFMIHGYPDSGSDIEKMANPLGVTVTALRPQEDAVEDIK